MPPSQAPPRALRVLHVANFGYKAKGVFVHGVATKLTNGWTRAGHNVVNFSDRDVARWAGPFRHRKWGILPANAILRQLALDIRPDVIAFGHADVISISTIAAIRERLPDTRVLQWTVDPLFDPDTMRRETARLPVVDATFASTPGAYLDPFKAGGRIAGFLPNPADLSIERLRNFERTEDELPIDLFISCGSPQMARTHCGLQRTPHDLAEAMTKAVPALSPFFAGIGNAPYVFGPDYEATLSRARMGLNFSRRNDVPLYSSDRLAHLAGNGLAVLIDRASGYGSLFGDDMFAFYETEAELFEWVRRLKREDAKRRAMAEAGWRRYHALFDSTKISAYMIDALFGRHDPDKFEWPTLM